MSAPTGRENSLFWITRITQDSRTWRNTVSKQPWCELALLEKSQAAGTAVLSQTEGSPRPHPVSEQPVADAQRKSTRAGQVQQCFLRFILPVSGKLEFRDFLSQGCIFISAVEEPLMDFSFKNFLIAFWTHLYFWPPQHPAATGVTMWLCVGCACFKPDT